MYMSPVVLVATGVIIVWRKVCLKLDRQGMRVPLWLHYYVPLYLMLASVLVRSFVEMFYVLGPTGWLDPDQTEQLVMHIVKSRNASSWSGEEKQEFHQWEEEASVDGQTGLGDTLILFSFSAPVWLVITFFICTIHTIDHLRYCKDGLGNHKQHDATILILALPLFYGVAAFQGVIRMWQVITDYQLDAPIQSWESKKEFLFELYDSDFIVGDIWESYALFIFGRVAMRVIFSRQNQRRTALERTSTLGQLQSSAGKQSKVGILYFCIVCVVTAIYEVAMGTILYYDLFPIKTYMSEKSRVSLHYFFYGMGFITSCAAIHNLANLEQDFGEKFLGKFRPFTKFWSTKVIVSLAFFQQLLLYIPPFNRWSKTVQNLFYASLFCLESSALAFFHLFAWIPSESWYAETEVQKDGEDESLKRKLFLWQREYDESSSEGDTDDSSSA